VYRPLKEVVVMEYVQYPTAEALIHNLMPAVRAGQPVALLWAEGVVFSATFVQPDTESVARELIEGRVYCSGVQFALMTSYTPTLRVGGIELPVNQVSPNPTLSQVARWLKKRAQG